MTRTPLGPPGYLTTDLANARRDRVESALYLGLECVTLFAEAVLVGGSFKHADSINLKQIAMNQALAALYLTVAVTAPMLVMSAYKHYREVVELTDKIKDCKEGIRGK